ncbi:MAG: ACT domain-containing protein [Clostridiales bacterium]|nr:ACT domain-containing protein [Clostridiales bacterium]
MKIIENITLTEDVTLISLQDSPADIKTISNVFGMISNADIDVDMISQTPPTGVTTNLSFTVNSNDFSKVLVIAKEIREIDANIKINISSGNCKVSVTGDGMRGKPGVVSKIFSALSQIDVDIIMITTSEVDVSFLVGKSDSELAVQAIKDMFK